MKNAGILFIIGLLLFTSCNDDDNDSIIQFKIASDTTILVNPESNTEVEYLLIWNDTYNRWQHITKEIQGFSYEKGYEYLLKVKSTKIKNPPMDGASVIYTLIEVISKVKKDSENLPQ